MKLIGMLMVLAIAACDGSQPAAEGIGGDGAGGSATAGAGGGASGGSDAGAGTTGGTSAGGRGGSPGTTGTAGAQAGATGGGGRGGSAGTPYAECARPNSALSCAAKKDGMLCGICSHVNCVVTEGFDGNNVSRGLPPDLCVASCGECSP